MSRNPLLGREPHAVRSLSAEVSAKVLGAISLQTKVMGIVVVIALLVGGAAIAQERRDLYGTLTTELEVRGRTTALDLATRGVDFVVTRDLFALQSLLSDTLSHNQDMLYAFYVDASGQVIVDTFPAGVPPDLLASYFPAPEGEGSTSMAVVATERGLVRDVGASLLGGEAGTIRVGLGEERIMRAINAATRRLVFMTLVAAGVALAAGLMLSRVLVAPVRALVSAMRAVGAGDMSRRVALQSGDEIGFLGRSFNQMVEELEDKTHQSEHVRADLERKNLELRTLQLLSTEAAGSLGPGDYVAHAVDLSAGSLHATGGWICIYRPDQNEPTRVATGVASRWVGNEGGPCAGCIGASEEPREGVWESTPRPCARGFDSAQNGALGSRALTAPIPLQEGAQGVLGLVYQAGGLEAGDMEAVVSVAGQIGLVLQNLRLREDREAREARLARLLSNTLRAQESERARIARELHDDAGQNLTYLKLGLKVLEDKLGGDGEIPTLARKLRVVANDSLEDVRRMAVELRPPVLDDLGLVRALERLLRRSSASLGFRADFQTLGVGGLRVDTDRQLVAYRVVQEALTNVGRHAACTRVSLVLEHRSDTLVIVVEDDGVGFSPDAVLADEDPARHLGLDGMRERVELAGGRLWIESTLGMGTAVHARLPLAGGSEADA